jgi:hypothetical protein
MKTKFRILIACLLALVLIFSLTACDKGGTGGGTGGGGGGGAEGGNASLSTISGLSSSTAKGTVESNLSTACGITLTVPQSSSVSGEVYNASALEDLGVSSDINDTAVGYVVTLSGAEVTACSYYESLVSSFEGGGYTAYEDSLMFTKNDRTNQIIYVTAVIANSDGASSYSVVSFAYDYSDAGDEGEQKTKAEFETRLSQLLGFNITLGNYFSTITVTDEVNTVGSVNYNGAFTPVAGTTEDTVVNDLRAKLTGYTYNGRITEYGESYYSWTKTKSTYMQESIEFSTYGGFYNLSFYLWPENSTDTSWPASDIEDLCGADRIPEFETAEGEFDYDDSVDGYAPYLRVAEIRVDSSTEQEFTAYKSALTTAGYTYGTDDEIYVKSFADKSRLEIAVEYDAYNPYLLIIFYPSSGNLNAWPTGRLSTDFSNYTLPAINGGSSFAYFSVSAMSESMGILTAYGITSAEYTAYLTTLTTAGYKIGGEDSYYLVNSARNEQFVVDLDYDEGTEGLTMILSTDEYSEPLYKSLPTGGLKMEYEESSAAQTFWYVGNNFYWAETDSSYNTTEWKALIYDNAIAGWYEYTYSEYNGDVAWVKRDDYYDSTIDGQLEYYWSYLFDIVISGMTAGDVYTEVSGLPAATMYSESSYVTEYKAITNDGKFCLYVAESNSYSSSIYETFKVTSWTTTGVTAPELPVAISTPVAWPTTKIATDIGANKIPTFTSTDTPSRITYKFTSNENLTSAELEIYGVTADDLTAYVAALKSAGYVLSKDVYTKVFPTDGKRINIELKDNTENYNEIDVEISVVNYPLSTYGTSYTGEWPSAAIATDLGAGLIPDYDTEAAEFYYPGGMVYVNYTTVEELAAWEAKLVTAGYVKTSAEGASATVYQKVQGDIFAVVNFCESDGDYGFDLYVNICAWQTEKIAEVCGDGVIPIFTSDTVTTISTSISSNNIMVSINGAVESDYTAFGEALVANGFVLDSSTGYYTLTQTNGNVLMVTYMSGNSGGIAISITTA